MTDRGSTTDWQQRVMGWKFLRVFGISALVVGAVSLALWLFAVVVLIAPLTFWLAWNVLEFGPAIGLPELGLFGILLATLFLVVGWFGRVLLTAIVFLIEPTWFQAEALMRWPEPTMRNFIAVALLAALAATPHAGDHHKSRHERGWT